ncbi:MAG: peptidoglycan-binding domain-containing protein [Burkholderiaceae bacterium]
MNNIDLNNAEQRNGAVYFVVGRGTEGGAASYRLSVAGAGNNEWGTVSAVAANSGYSIGTIQVDLGQRGTWPRGATSERALAPGEQSYVDAIVDQVSAYAGSHKRAFPTDPQELANLRADLLTHGNGLNGRSSITFISEEHRATINAWASSDQGKQWIHSHIDFPQIQSLADDAKQVLDQHGANIPPERQFEVLCVLAKTANQHPASNARLVNALRNGADYNTFMAAVEEREAAFPYLAGSKAGDLAQQYQENHQKPGNAILIDEAHRLVAQTGYQPANEAAIPSVQLALGAFRRDLNDPSVLDRGDKGEDVRLLQQALMGSGQALSDDGDFGRGTERALTAYQREHGLETTGFGDRPTLRSLGIAPCSTSAAAPLCTA